MAVEVGDRVDVTDMLPAALGVSGGLSQVVQGMTETIRPYQHTVEWNTTPFAPWDTQLLGSPTAAVSGKVCRGGTSIGVENVTVARYSDAGGMIGSLLASTTTDSNGDYSFTGLFAGKEWLRFTAPMGETWEADSSTDLDILHTLVEDTTNTFSRGLTPIEPTVRGFDLTTSADTIKTIDKDDFNVLPVAGDTILTIVNGWGPTPAPGPITWTDPSGSTVLGTQDAGASAFQPRMRVTTFVYDGEETWSAGMDEQNNLVSIAIQNAVALDIGSFSSGTSPQDPTSVAHDGHALGIAAWVHNFNGETKTAAPSGHTTVADTGAVNQAMYSASDSLGATAGSYDPGMYTYTGSNEQTTSVSITAQGVVDGYTTGDCDVGTSEATSSGGGGGPGSGLSGGSGAEFNNGAPGDYAVNDIADREDWYWNYDVDYFEPQHDPADDGPVRTVYVSASGTGNGLTSGTPTTLAKYLAADGITPTAGDQVRIQGVGPHDINSGTERSINGTADDPIRFVRDAAGTIPVIKNSANANSTWPFTDSSYLGFHGLDIDGDWPANNNIWGLSFGQRFGSDSGMKRCHHIDVWHCEIHDQAQNNLTFEGTNGGGADNKSHHLHVFACEIHHSGQDSNKTFSEPTYFGSGSDTSDHAHDVCLEATFIHNGPSGEAIDIKNDATDFYVVACKINNIRTESQGAIAAFKVADLYYHYCAMWDIDQTASGSEGCGIWCSSIDVDYAIMWNIGATAFISSRLQRGTLGVQVRHFTGWDLQQTANLGQGDLHFQNVSTFDEGNLPTIDFDATCISDDGDQGSVNAAASDFVGPTTGDAEATAGEPGSGFLLDSASSIAATAGALGKE